MNTKPLVLVDVTVRGGGSEPLGCCFRADVVGRFTGGFRDELIDEALAEVTQQLKQSILSEAARMRGKGRG